VSPYLLAQTLKRTFIEQIFIMKTSRKILSKLLLLLVIFSAWTTSAQTSPKKILIDVAHGQKFWNDPADMKGMDPKFIERVKYMTDQISKSAASVNATIGYVKGKTRPADLATCDLLFIHIPSAKYGQDEVVAIRDYLQKVDLYFWLWTLIIGQH
jgi:hypothetical protein